MVNFIGYFIVILAILIAIGAIILDRKEDRPYYSFWLGVFITIFIFNYGVESNTIPQYYMKGYDDALKGIKKYEYQITNTFQDTVLISSDTTIIKLIK